MTATVLPLRRGPGRQLTQDGRQVLRIYPLGYGPRSASGHWMYAVGFHDGRIKLGLSCKPRSRLIQHWIASEGAVAWTHLFRRFSNRGRAGAVERAALTLAAAASVRIRLTETFRGLTRAEAMRCVRQAIAEHG